MKDMFTFYTKYKQHIPEYKKWQDSNKNRNVIASYPVAQKTDTENIRRKAQIITDPLLIQDAYEHEKAEDAETFYQTLNIELVSVATLIASLPIAIKKLVPFLDKFAKNNNIAQKLSSSISQYANSSIKIASKKIPLSNALTILSSMLGMAFYAFGIKKSMQSQLGLIKKASFDSTQNIINDPKIFADLTEEQEKELAAIINSDRKNNTSIVDKLQDKINLKSTFQSVKEYKETNKAYQEEREEYFNKIEQNKNKRAYKYQLDDAKEDKFLFDHLLKNVEHDVLERLRKVETIANIGYSSIFMGGFLEYLLTDKLVQVLGVRNKLAASAIKFGAPLITYMLLNKNISDVENKAILATKYKHLKEFSENPLQYNMQDNNKDSLPKFVKSVYKDMKEYEKFSEEELPKIKEKIEAKRRISISPEQEKKAKALQRNTQMVINKHREEVYNQTVGIKAFSESILGPIDIISTATGAILGQILAKTTAKSNNARLYKGLGALIMFIPAAIIEAKLTEKQKQAEKIAAMKTIKDIQDEKLFVYHSPNENKTTKIPEVEKEFF